MNSMIKLSRYFQLPIYTILIIYISGCAAIENPMVERSVDWDRRNVSRVAFLPVLSEERYEEAAELLQRSMYINLSKMPEFHIIEPLAVEKILAENDLLIENQWQNASSQKLGELLNADILLKTELLRFGMVYAIIETTAKVGAEVEFIDAKSGASLYKTRKGVTASRGLSGIPTGFSSVVLEPIRGMGVGARKDLVRQLAADIVDSLDPNLYLQDSNESDENQTALQPRFYDIHAVYSRDHRHLDVTVKMPSKFFVSFWFSGLSGPYPMKEISPGEYNGRFMLPEEFMAVPPEILIRAIRRDGATISQLVEVMQP